jgi:hypothetical protein
MAKEIVMREIVMRSIIGLTLSTFVLFLGACLTAPDSVDEAAGTSSSEQLTTTAVDEGEDARIDTIKVEGVIDFSLPEYANIYYSTPVDGVPRFFATVPRMADREKEYDHCLNMAAMQASRFLTSKVFARFATKTSGRNFGSLEEVEVTYDKEAAVQLKERITPLSFYQDREASYMIAEFDGPNLGEIVIDNSLKEGLPVWITNPPEIPGYITGMGTVKRFRYVAESIFQADKMALANIARARQIEVKSKQDNYAGSDGSASGKEIQLEVTDTVLKGAYIVARWRSLDGENYYSLAVYPRGR